MQYRRLVPGDFAAVAEFAVEGLRPELYTMLLSLPKIHAVIQHFCNSQTDFHLGAFDDKGRLVGGIAAAFNDLLWFERGEAIVVMCRAVVPGVGRELILALKRWADRDMRVRRVQFPLEFDARPGTARLLRSLGFAQQTSNCVYSKG